jgi:hypothetical protein
MVPCDLDDRNADPTAIYGTYIRNHDKEIRELNKCCLPHRLRSIGVDGEAVRANLLDLQADCCSAEDLAVTAFLLSSCWLYL